jgi:ComF family protein
MPLLKQLLFPDICASCNKFVKKSEAPVCSECRSPLKLNQTLVCGSCRARLPESKKICHPDSYLLGIATSYHQPVIEKTIQALKFRYLESSAPFLVSLLINFTDKLNPPPRILNQSPLVINIPLSKPRLKERGFDQSALLAKIFATNYKLEYKPNLLIRIKDRSPQSLLTDKKERQENIKNVFQAQDNSTNKKLPLIIIDDITTTGSTLDEAIRILRQTNYGPILALTVAG